MTKEPATTNDATVLGKSAQISSSEVGLHAVSSPVMIRHPRDEVCRVRYEERRGQAKCSAIGELITS